MLLAFGAAILVVLIAVSAALGAQAWSAHARQRDLERRRLVFEIAQRAGGALTARDLAEALQLDENEAEDLLRSMVDDYRLSMAVDDRLGRVRYWTLAEALPASTAPGPSAPRARRETRDASSAPGRPGSPIERG